MPKKTLYELTKTVRSKNASVDHITFDVIFSDQAVYEYVRDNRLVTEEDIAALYDIPLEKINVFVYFDPAKALKFTLSRPQPSGGPGEGDVYGAQQYAPLFDVELSIPESLAD
ncbi:DUF4387 domain-containing protein [Natronosalvus rutilus]|uniref:DUF4387 domain-containing protein n=1 Tax=Natronosalvus rutilus TaxID=2953753 RepID=A0A9E7ND65_9EURY|nr:DUF4387 domain-containing protein [Natronosalvus rutilus]UTF54784.1 DUF4387 domain-containing protein [Natronosalvus rutilus]